MKYFDYSLFFLPILEWSNTRKSEDEYETPVIVKISAEAIPTKATRPTHKLHAEFTWDQYRSRVRGALQHSDTQLELERESFLRNLPVVVDHVSRDVVIDRLGFEEAA